MSRVDQLAAEFRNHIGVGWPAGSSGAQRVVMLIYDPSDERMLRRKLDIFAQAARENGLRWELVDLTQVFASWLGGHRYREGYFEEPDYLADALEPLVLAVTREIEAVLERSEHDANELVGVLGVSSLFGLCSIADVLSRVDHAIKGRLIVFFPGSHREGRYQLLDARESWDYHAIAIQVDTSGVRT
jgi:hypothetical protein